MMVTDGWISEHISGNVPPLHLGTIVEPSLHPFYHSLEAICLGRREVTLLRSPTTP